MTQNISINDQAELAKYLKPRLTKYIIHKPHPKQAAFLLLNQQEVMFGGAGSSGKAMELSTYVPTSYGHTTIGDLKVGDVIFNEFGLPTTVLEVFDIIEKPESYRVTFDDNSHIDACADHKWYTFNKTELARFKKSTDEYREKRRANRPKRGNGSKPWLAERNAARAKLQIAKPAVGSVRTTKEILDTLMYRNEGPRRECNHTIPNAKALELPEADLLLDPYCLGAWLGDGTAIAGVLAGIDPEIWQQFEKAGFVVTDHKNPYTHGILGFIGYIKKLGLYNNKHIPAQYLRGSIEQRLALLQGLMDTDGTVEEHGHPQFANTNLRIAEGALEIIRSLGWKAKIREDRAMLYGVDHGPCYNIDWTADRIVFRLKRKADKQVMPKSRVSQFHYIRNVEPIDPIPMRCIRVDNPTGLFLVGKSMIPTHNSDSLLMAALQYVDVPGYSALILRRTFADLSLPGAIMDRARQWISQFPEVHWSEKLHRFTFPSGATLQFGYLETANDKYRYQGAEFQYVGFDELSQFPKADYEYLFTRLRRTKTSNIPLRMRSATNPGGPHGIWVREYFVDKPDPSKRIFLPATVHDNPTVSYEEYKATLERVNEVDRARMLYGDWDIQPEGLVYPEMDKTIFDPAEKFASGEDRVWKFPIGEHYGGIDWGFTSPAVFLVGVLDENKHFWIYYERYVRGKTVAEHAEALPRENEVLYFADSADPQSIAQLKKEDFVVRKANKDIKFGINIVHEWIRSGRLHISSDCKALFQEAKLYRRKSTQVKGEQEVGDHEGGDPDIPIKKNDHALDSLRYTLVGVHKLIGGLPKHENSVEEVVLPDNQVEMKKQWKSSESPYKNFDLDKPDKEEIKRHHDWNNPRWWNK